MNHEVDAALKRELARFALKFACEDCAHFDAATACSLGYPNEAHLRASIERSGRLTFCKEFELF